MSKGFTLIEVIFGAAIFLLFVVSAYYGFAAVQRAVSSTHHKTLAADIANQEFEIIKNLSYGNIGTASSTPTGILPVTKEVSRDRITFTVTTTVRTIDDPFDGVSGSGDAFPRDYKLVELVINCPTCRNFAPVVITGRVAPKNLESALNNIFKPIV